MSIAAMLRRLSALERAATPAVALYAWQDPSETAEQIIARLFPEGVPPNARVVLYRWASTPSDGASTG